MNSYYFVYDSSVLSTTESFEFYCLLKYKEAITFPVAHSFGKKKSSGENERHCCPPERLNPLPPPQRAKS